MSLRVLRRALHGIAQTPGLFVAVTTAVALSLFLVSTFWLTGQQLKLWMHQVVGLQTAVVYLKPDVDGKAAKGLQDEIKKLSEVSEVSVQTPDASLKRLSSVLGEELDASLGQLVGYSLEVKVADHQKLVAMSQSLMAMPGVEEVDFGKDVFDRVSALGRLIDGVGLGLLLLVLLVCLFVVNMTVSLSLFVRREEIQIQRIVGAHDAFVLWPLLLEAALAGLVGAMLASGSLSFLLERLGLKWSATLATLDVHLPDALDPKRLAVLLVSGVALSFLGTLLASVRHLRSTE